MTIFGPVNDNTECSFFVDANVEPHYYGHLWDCVSDRINRIISTVMEIIWDCQASFCI